MSFIYRNKKKITKFPDTFEFQAFEWKGFDIVEEDDEANSSDESEQEYKPQEDGEYNIRVYGVTEDSESVCLIIKNFTPYFFVKIPESWTKFEIRKLISYIKGKVYFKYKNSLVNSTIVKRKDFNGFTNNKMFKFLRFEFKSHGAYRSYARELDKAIRIPSISNSTLWLKLYESNIDPFLRFIHVKDLSPSGWIKLEKDKFKYQKVKISLCQYELECDWLDVEPSTKTHIAPLLIASFDIECTSIDGSFPNAERPGDEIIQIGTTINRYGEKECCLKHIITLGKCNPIDGVVVESYDTEEEVLLAWSKFIRLLDPDIITGYNIWGFDFKYCYDRAKFLGCEKNFSKISRVRDMEGKLIEKQLSSSALGQNQFYILETEGRVQIDLMKLVQKDYKLDMYKLDFVANHFLKSNKVDLSPKELFKKYREFTPDSIRDIAVYCVQDCELCNKLVNKLEAVTNNIGMANVCYVPFSWLFLRGQGVKIYSLVAKKCRELGFLIKTLKKSEDPTGYEGAIVLVATPGIYLNPISVMDYSSLYPSCMISENISHDTIVWFKIYNNDGIVMKDWGNRDYCNLPDYEYITIEYDNFEDAETGNGKVKTGKTVCCFAESKTGDKGVMPKILENLLFERRKTRASIKYKKVLLVDGTEDEGFVKEVDDKIEVTKYKEKPIYYEKDEVVEIVKKNNEFQEAILDGLQLAYKITANSLYGQIGAKTSPIHFKELAACTTATGRNLLKFARSHTEEQYPGTVCVYGDTDSIFVDFSKYWENKLGLKLEGKEALQKSIDLGIEAGKSVTSCLKKPHDLEYEKTFYPFIQLAKKRYVGNLYELDINKFKQKSMGIVLKRRDNANIVKIIYGGIIDIIMSNQNILEAREYFLEQVDNLLNGKVELKDLIITKTLRSEYKNPEQQAHKVLADRMAERDPGNKPQSNDRIPFVYIYVNNDKIIQNKKIRLREQILMLNIKNRVKSKGVDKVLDEINKIQFIKGTGDTLQKVKDIITQTNTDINGKLVKLLSDRVKVLQGDRVEHPDYIKQNKKIKIDYRYYLDKQVTVPCVQLFALALNELPGYRKLWTEQNTELTISKWKAKDKNEKDIESKVSDLKEKETKRILIGDILNKDDNDKKGNSMITDFFSVKKGSPLDEEIFGNTEPLWKKMKNKKKIDINQLNKNLEEKNKNNEDKSLKDKIINPNYSAKKRMQKIKENKKEEAKKKRKSTRERNAELNKKNIKINVPKKKKESSIKISVIKEVN